jgi:hypothetical protein
LRPNVGGFEKQIDGLRGETECGRPANESPAIDPVRYKVLVQRVDPFSCHGFPPTATLQPKYCQQASMTASGHYCSETGALLPVLGSRGETDDYRAKDLCGSANTNYGPAEHL